MTAEICIVSGFLGAGKTTLIQKLLREAFLGERVVLLENDFGEVSVDAALLRAGGAEVAELRAGCICCSLSGDLIKTRKKLLKRYKPDKLNIEPSGVGKLSEVAAACEDAGVRALAEVRRKLTVVDALRCQSYLENFGAFFADQIEHADAVLLSRADERPGAAETARALVRTLNARAPVFCEPWARVRAAELLSLRGSESGPESEAGDDRAEDVRCTDEHEHKHGHKHGHEYGYEHERGHEHAHEHEHGHAHAAEDVFETLTIRTDLAFGADDLKARALRMGGDAHGTVLRAKGVLRGTRGPLNLQYLPGDARVEPVAAVDAEGTLCVIGRDLNGPALAALFGGVVQPTEGDGFPQMPSDGTNQSISKDRQK
jgi:G3E family GTPase